MAGYSEVLPSPAVAGVVDCLWERTAADEGADVLVLPDGCVDLVWWSDGTFLVAGPDLASVEHRQRAGVSGLGLRLRPGTVGTVLGVAAEDLAGDRVELADLWGRIAGELSERIDDAGSSSARFGVLTELVAARLADEEPDDQVLAAAGALARGGTSVAAVADDVGLGERQLRRRFHHQVGYGPKVLDRVLRLQRFLALAAVPDRSLASMAAHAGYADQAHLVRDCRSLTDRTPTELVQRWWGRDVRNVQDPDGVLVAP